MKVFIKKKGKVYEFLDKGKIDIMEVWEWKEIFFNAGSFYKYDISLVFTKVFMIF